MRCMKWTMMVVLAVAFTGVIGCDNANKSEKGSAVGSGASGEPGGMMKKGSSKEPAGGSN